MAIKFDLFENPVKEGISSPKLHAKVITKDVVTTREIREAIHKKCTASPADVAAVITALNDELYEKLSDGYTVHLDGIGYFSLSLKCAPDINPRYIIKFQKSQVIHKFISPFLLHHIHRLILRPRILQHPFLHQFTNHPRRLRRIKSCELFKIAALQESMRFEILN